MLELCNHVCKMYIYCIQLQVCSELQSTVHWTAVVSMHEWANCSCARLKMLRVRAVFHKTVRVCHIYCNFKLGFTCRITVIFGTLKDGSLLINTLASNICFSYRNTFQNGVDASSKIVDAFLSKSSKFYLVRIIRKCSIFASLWHKHLLRNYKWHFRLPM